MNRPAVPVPGAAIVGVTTFVALGLANGAYKPAVYEWSVAAFWLLDALHFVAIPVATMVMLVRMHDIRPSDYGLKIPRTGRDCVDVVALAAICSVLYWALYETVAKVLFRVLDPSLPVFLYSHTVPDSGVWRYLTLAYLSLSAAAAEEVVCRALPWLLVSKVLPYGWAAVTYVVVSSIVFASIHEENGPHEVLATGVLGLFAAGFYLQTRTLWPLICAHFVADWSSLG